MKEIIEGIEFISGDEAKGIAGCCTIPCFHGKMARCQETKEIE